MEAAPHPWPALGVLLMRDGLVSKEDLEAILNDQRDSRQQRITGRRLGEILIARGDVTPTQVAKLVAEQYELPFVDLDVSDIDLGVASLLTEELARRFSAVPISWRPDGSLLLAIADPGTVIFSDELRGVLGASTRFAVVGPVAIEAAIVFVYEQNATPSPPQAVEAPNESLVVELQPLATTSPASPRAGDEKYFGDNPTAAHLWPPLGALLMREGLVSDAELETALAQQRLSASRRLGEILVERGVVTRATVARLVAEQYELDYVELSEVEVDPTAATLLSENMARDHAALPIAFLSDGSIRVVVADPTSVLHSDELHLALGRPISLAVAAPDAIAAAISSVHQRERMRALTAHLDQVVEAEPVSVAAPAVAEPEEPVTHVEAESANPLDVAPELAADPIAAVLALADVAVEPHLAETTPFAAVEETVGAVVEDELSRSFADDLAEPLFAETAIADVAQETQFSTETPEPVVEVFAAPESFETETTEPTFEPISWFEPTPVLPFEEVGTESHVGEVVELGDIAETTATSALDKVVERKLDLVREGAVDEVVELEDISVNAVTSGFGEVVERNLDLVRENETDEVAEPEVVEAAVEATVDLGHEAEVEEVVDSVVDLDATIERALALGASSIHFSTQPEELVVRARIDGMLRELARVPSEDEQSAPRSFASTDRVRVDVLPTVRGEKVTLLVHENVTPATLDELGIAADAEEWVRGALQQPAGTFLVCGPARSGATTTVYAALAALNTPDRSLVTVEDPVERLTDGVDQVQVDESTGLTFAQGLRSILRTEPDVVLVGEIRDAETAEVAFQAARAGHVVLSTMHAPTAVAALGQLSELGLDPDLVSATLTCVVAQRLVRRICTDCRETFYATETDLQELDQPVESDGPRLLARGRGCPSCDHTGFKGRTGIFEVLPLTEEIRVLVAERASAKEIQRAAVSAGMRTLRADGVRLCLEGVTTAAEVRRVVGTNSL